MAGEGFLLELALPPLLLLLLLLGRLSLTFHSPVLDLMTGGDLGEQEESSSSAALGWLLADGCNRSSSSSLSRCSLR